jgi:hypothetical protein
LLVVESSLQSQSIYRSAAFDSEKLAGVNRRGQSCYLQKLHICIV